MRLRVVPLLAVMALAAHDTRADRTLPEYRYFRALSIDLLGRPPTRDELADFEQPGFNLDAWLDTHLTGASYAERLRRIYEDLLRLEVGPSFQYVPGPITLRRARIQGPDGTPVDIYFRRGQRRANAAIDGELCFTPDETGLTFAPNVLSSTGWPHPVEAALFEARTVAVKPWWLYADYRSSAPTDRYAPEWAKRFPGFVPAPALLVEPDGTTPTTEVRVCREEAQTAETGTVYASGRLPPPKGEPLPAGRLTPAPLDSGFAKTAKGRAVSCLTGTGFQSSLECGCGVGLERCMPGVSTGFESAAFVIPANTPLGGELPFEASPQPASSWLRMWWAEEARQVLDRIFESDRDFREVLTSRATLVNGPLAQFYRKLAGATCCGGGADFGYTQADALVEPQAVPEALVPSDTATWMPVPDRGPHAAGILTMPIFLAKYGSRRARAHVAYSAFLCKDFVADSVKLEPSTEPDLTKRAGCSACHQTLEPMAAYFTRISESDWTYLPARQFPMSQPRCVKGDKMPGNCKPYYDPAFGVLRGAYAGPSNAEKGPAGLGDDIVRSPEFAPCVVQNVAESLLGRQLAPEDDAWKTALTRVFVDGGYRMRGLVRAILTSRRYREGNDVKR